MSVDYTPGILIVDDDEDVLLLLSHLLGGDSHKISYARNGQEALDMVKEQSFSLVITDMVMPEMNGLTLSKEIRKITPQTEVIIMTSYGDVDSYIDAVEAGVYDYFHKPFDFELFRETVNRIMENKASLNN